MDSTAIVPVNDFIAKFKVNDLAIVTDIDSPLYEHLVKIIDRYCSGYYYFYGVVQVGDDVSDKEDHVLTHMVKELFLMKV